MSIHDQKVRHVLVAEDNSDDLLLLRRAFMKAGYPVIIHPVCDGSEAVAYLAGSGSYADRSTHPHPDIIILDIKMPRLSGLDVLKWMKEHPEHQTIPTIMMSASGLDADVEQSYSFGANTFFVKPGSFDELVALAKLLNEYWQKAMKPRKH